MARYIIRGTNDSGLVEFGEPLTIDSALQQAADLRRSGFRRITIVNVITGVEITDLEALIAEQGTSELPGNPNFLVDRPDQHRR